MLPLRGMSGHAHVDVCSSRSWFQLLEQRVAKLEVTVEELQSAKSLAPVPLARVPSGPPVHAAPAAPATPAAAAPATPAAVVVASPLTSAAAVMSMAKVKAEKYVSKKDQRAVLDDTQQAGVRTLESWYLARVAAVYD